MIIKNDYDIKLIQHEYFELYRNRYNLDEMEEKRYQEISDAIWHYRNK